MAVTYHGGPSSQGPSTPGGAASYRRKNVTIAHAMAKQNTAISIFPHQLLRRSSQKSAIRGTPNVPFGISSGQPARRRPSHRNQRPATTDSTTPRPSAPLARRPQWAGDVQSGVSPEREGPSPVAGVARVAVVAVIVRGRKLKPFQHAAVIEGFDGFVTFPAASTASGWSDLARAGLPPTGNASLSTAHREMRVSSTLYPCWPTIVLVLHLKKLQAARARPTTMRIWRVLLNEERAASRFISPVRHIKDRPEHANLVGRVWDRKTLHDPRGSFTKTIKWRLCSSTAGAASSTRRWDMTCVHGHAGSGRVHSPRVRVDGPCSAVAGPWPGFLAENLSQCEKVSMRTLLAAVALPHRTAAAAPI